MNSLRKIVLVVALLLLALWLYLNLDDITFGPAGAVRLVLGALFAGLVILRPRPEPRTGGGSSLRSIIIGAGSSLFFIAIAGAGALSVVFGIVMEVNQLEWLGLVLTVTACLLWALPLNRVGDVVLAAIIFYWVHPLPGQFFTPAQMAMQRLSVAGAEWLLHIGNVRVWADGMILHSGFRVFEVPAACSGMATLVTVLLCSLGVGVLFRFKWYQLVPLMILALVQVLVLNVARISFMVSMTDSQTPTMSIAFLHDSAGIFLLAAIVLIQMEAVLWRRFLVRKRGERELRKKGKKADPNEASIFNLFWRRAIRWGPRIALLVVLMLAIAFALFKRRPVHRAAMITGIIDELIINDLEAAERAAVASLNLLPGDQGVIDRQIKIMLMRHKFDEGLRILSSIAEEERTDEHSVLQAWAFMGLERYADAARMVDAVPEARRRAPDLALLRAELAALRGDTEEVVANILRAADVSLMARRVRSLFPYLAGHQQWHAIAQSDSDVPYDDLATLSLAISANMKMGDLVKAGKLLEEALDRWPDEAGLIGHIVPLVVVEPSGKWGERFADKLKSDLDSLGIDELATYLDCCFKMRRPDLAWLVYIRIREIDPADPAVYLAPARFGHRWLLFQKRRLGIGTIDPNEEIDLRECYHLTRSMPLVYRLWEHVPLIEELAGDLAATRQAYLRAALVEFECRQDRKDTSLRILMSHIEALMMTERFEDVHKRLDAIEKQHPGKHAEFLYRHALTYDRQKDWQQSYETLREYFAALDEPNLSAELLLIRTLLHLDLGVSARAAAERAVKEFPGSPEARLAMAAIWDAFGFEEEALFELGQIAGKEKSPVVVGLLHETE